MSKTKKIGKPKELKKATPNLATILSNARRTASLYGYMTPIKILTILCLVVLLAGCVVGMH